VDIEDEDVYLDTLPKGVKKTFPFYTIMDGGANGAHNVYFLALNQDAEMIRLTLEHEKSQVT
jgi:hypothetical protein